jgi:anti-anti-sigma factor
MPEAPNQSVFLVDAYSDPVVVRVEGRACFTGSGSLQEFFRQMTGQGKARFVVDLQNCTSMDSTFLGVLAGEALALRRREPAGSLVLCRVGPRNLELVRNLGLHRLLTVDAGDFPLDFSPPATPLANGRAHSDVEAAYLVLEAHENLVAADPANRGKFQDVLAFLRRRLEQI